MNHIWLLFGCSLLCCAAHYLFVLLTLSSSAHTLHVSFGIDDRKEAVSRCLLARNATVCCRDCDRLLNRSKVLTIPVGGGVCPSSGVIVDGEFRPLGDDLVSFECFCSQCRESQR